MMLQAFGFTQLRCCYCCQSANIIMVIIIMIIIMLAKLVEFSEKMREVTRCHLVGAAAPVTQAVFVHPPVCLSVRPSIRTAGRRKQGQRGAQRRGCKYIYKSNGTMG